MKLTKSTWSSILAFILIMLCAVSLPEKANASDSLEFGPIDETTFWDDLTIIKDSLSVTVESSVEEVKPKLAVYLGAWSKHVGKHRQDKNETHNFIAVEYEGWLLGHMKNSFNEDTWVLAKDWTLGGLGDFGFGLLGGITHGYSENSVGKFEWMNWNKWMFMVAPYLEVNHFKESYGVSPRVVLFGNAVVVTLRYEF